jgi:hypothetical protein
MISDLNIKRKMVALLGTVNETPGHSNKVQILLYQNNLFNILLISSYAMTHIIKYFTYAIMQYI